MEKRKGPSSDCCPPPLFRQHRRRILFIAFTPRPVVNKTQGPGHCTTAIPFALAFRPKRVAVSPSTVCGKTSEDHFFCQSLAIFFHAKQARMAQEKRNKKRQLLYKMTIFFLSHMHWLGGEKRQFRFSFDVPPEQTARRRISHLNGADVTEASSSSCFPQKWGQKRLEYVASMLEYTLAITAMFDFRATAHQICSFIIACFLILDS